MSFDRCRRIFTLPCTGNHGIMSLYLVIILLSAAIPWASAQAQPSPNGDQYQYSQFTPSMAIIIAVLITALFFMGFFSVYIRNCSDSQSNNPNTVRGRGMSRRGAAARGLDASVIETFPTLVYSVVKGLKIGKSALECAVCLSEFEDHETLRLIPKCDHVFHPECIDEWLSSHTTCPVCRANLVPQPGDSVPTLTELHPEFSDLEAQNDAVDPNHQNVEHEQGGEREEHEALNVNQTLKRNRTRGSRSGRSRIFQFPLPFPRSHSTGHSLVQPGENTERFTLRLPVEVRKKIMNQKLNRAMSMVILPREGSSRQGYRTGGEGSGRGKSHMRFEKSDRAGKLDPWVFSMTPPFFMRESSFKLLKVVANDGEGTSAQPVRPEGSTSKSIRPPV